jgi:hypothetical protein
MISDKMPLLFNISTALFSHSILDACDHTVVVPALKQEVDRRAFFYAA